MTRSYKAVSISFLALALLVGCDDSTPSNSDIKKQISAQLSPCPELSISDFQKINGYPQNDGSYIENVQYTLTFTPSQKMRNLLDDYDQKFQASTNAFDAMQAKYQEADHQAGVDQRGCGTTYC